MIKDPFKKKRLRSGEARTKGSLINRKAVNVTNVFFVPGVKTYTEGWTQDCAVTPEFIQDTVSTLDPKFKYVGTEISCGIWNRSGAADDYSWTLTNTTKGTTLYSVVNSNIVNKAFSVWQFIFGKDLIDTGDLLRFEITTGVVGTGAGQAQNGQIVMSRSILVKSISLANWLGTSQ